MITPEQEQAIRQKLAEMPVISVGVGTRESACSVAAINLALTGTLTDDIPDCMSEVVGRWIINIQDRMPTEIRNSVAWRRLLPLAAGTGRGREKERRTLMINEVWGLLAQLQSHADEMGLGSEWRRMCEEQTREAAHCACNATYAISTTTTNRLAIITEHIAIICTPSLDNTSSAAYIVNNIAKIIGWDTVNPCGLLENLIEYDVVTNYPTCR